MKWHEKLALAAVVIVWWGAILGAIVFVIWRVIDPPQKLTPEQQAERRAVYENLDPSREECQRIRVTDHLSRIFVCAEKGFPAAQTFLGHRLEHGIGGLNVNLAEAFESINPKRAIQEYETFLILAEDNPDEAGKVAIAKSKIKALQGGTNR